MTNEEFYKILSDVDERYVAAARRPQTVKTRAWLKRCAAAACLCAFLAGGWLLYHSHSPAVTAPGFLTITAHAASSDGSLVLQEGIGLPQAYQWHPAMSSYPGLPLTLSAPQHPQAVFDVSVDRGSLLLWQGDAVTRAGASFRGANDTTLYWTNLGQQAGSSDEERVTASDGETAAYLDIVIWEEGHIIGYAVVQIYTATPEDEPLQVYSAKLLQSVSLPKVKNAYQNVTAEEVAAQIEQIKTGAALTPSE